MFVALAAVFLIGALISYVGLFDQVENTTTLLAGASTGFATLAFAISRRAVADSGSPRRRRGQ